MRYHQTWCLWLILIILMSACTNIPQDTTLPTIAVLPSVTITPSPIPTRAMRQVENDLPPTWTLTPTPTATWTPGATSTSLPTWTRQPSATFTTTTTMTPSSDAYVSNEAGVHVRTGPSTRFNPPLETLDQNDPINILAISPEREWLKVQTASGQIGWVFLELITLNRELRPDLPEEFIPTPTASPQPIVQIAVTPGDLIVLGAAGVVATVNTNTSPPIGGASTVNNSGAANVISVSSRTRQIYQAGLSKGNNPRYFAKVGDSITNNQPFMNGFGSQEYDLGAYGYLQASIDFFDNGAFVRDSIAAESGFNAAAVLDAIWAPSGTCIPNESPLACEYRVSNPSIAVIMYGSVDVQLYGANTFQSYLNQIVQSTISRGIIPVLTTFPNGADYYPSQVEEFNNVIRSIASTEQIPLIEFRNPALNLPDRGVGEDKFHLSMNGTSYYIALTGEQNTYGLTLRNMLTLQALDDLRRELGMG